MNGPEFPLVIPLRPWVGPRLPLSTTTTEHWGLMVWIQYITGTTTAQQPMLMALNGFVSGIILMVCVYTCTYNCYYY